MAIPTDFQDTNQGDSAIHTPTAGSAIEFSVLSIVGTGGVESTKGAEITGSEDFDGTDNSALSRFAGDLKQMLKDTTMIIKASPTQLAEMELIVGKASRGSLVITTLSGATIGNASIDITSVDVSGGSTITSEQNTATVIFSPSGDANWVYTPAT
jgi:hypothetical protein